MLLLLFLVIQSVFHGTREFFFIWQSSFNVSYIPDTEKWWRKLLALSIWEYLLGANSVSWLITTMAVIMWIFLICIVSPPQLFVTQCNSHSIWHYEAGKLKPRKGDLYKGTWPMRNRAETWISVFKLQFQWFFFQCPFSCKGSEILGDSHW